MMNKIVSIMFLTMSIMMATMLKNLESTNSSIMVEWSMVNKLNTNLSLDLIMDYKSVTFSMIVMLITSAVSKYSEFYMKMSMEKTTFMKLMVSFVMMMMIVIFSANFISLILGWEGLGMTSFILIMFYKNKKSLTSSFFTMMMNRMGDSALVMGMLYMMNLNSWTIQTVMFNQSASYMIMIMIAMFSKSAQIPFSSWLTEAMAAPTPISALVHSSTLVTAGIFMIMRFEFTSQMMKMTNLMFLISSMTIMMAGMNSITEWDIKKIIALSTLMQLSIMFISMSFKLYNLTFFHLVMHAAFKALIFLCASSLINTFSTQDLRKMHFNNKLNMTKLSFNFANMSMCGFPFMSGFYSKEMIMEMVQVKVTSMMFINSFLVSMIMAMFYSMKLILTTNLNMNKKPMMKIMETKEQKTSKIMLMVPSSIMGNKLNWILNSQNKLPYLSHSQKMIPILMMIVVTIIIMEVMNKKTSTKINQKKMIMPINLMMFYKINHISPKNNKLTKEMLMMKMSEKGMKEMIVKKMIKKMKMTTNKELKINYSNMKVTLMMAVILTLIVKI